MRPTTDESARRAGAFIAGATALANVLAYGLSVVVSRQLGPRGFGEVAPLLALVLVASVPGQALQAGAARRAAQARGRDPGVPQLLLRATAVGGVVTIGLLLLAPALRALLDLPGWSALLWTSLSLLPLTVCFACYGVLQGAERFRRLALALVLVQATRLVGGTVGVAVAGTASGAMAGTALGVVLAAIGCLWLAAPRPLRNPSRYEARVLAGLARDTTAVLAVVVLTNLDVLLARSRLSASEAGLYAAGALVAKIAFFAPSFVAVVLYPRMSRPADRARALRDGGLALSAWAVLATSGAAIGGRLVSTVLGSSYAGLESSAWLFAAAGSILAGVYLLVQAGLAARDHRFAVGAWGVAALEVAVIVTLVGSLVQLVTVVVLGGLSLVVTGVLLERRPVGIPLPDEELEPVPGGTAG